MILRKKTSVLLKYSLFMQKLTEQNERKMAVKMTLIEVNCGNLTLFC